MSREGRREREEEREEKEKKRKVFQMITIKTMARCLYALEENQNLHAEKVEIE